MGEQIVGTGMTIRRPWYDASAADRQQDAEALSVQPEAEMDPTGAREDKYSPNVLLQEPGAVLCRVSKSFLRVSQLELFAKRGETRELLQLADYVCYREFPHLLQLKAGDDATTAAAAAPEASCVDTDAAFSAESIPPGSVKRYIEMYKEIIKGACFI